jgi:hypothetical protein
MRYRIGMLWRSPGGQQRLSFDHVTTERELELSVTGLSTRELDRLRPKLRGHSIQLRLHPCNPLCQELNLTGHIVQIGHHAVQDGVFVQWSR